MRRVNLKKYLIFGISFLVIGAIIFLFVKNNKKSPSTTENQSASELAKTNDQNKGEIQQDQTIEEIKEKYKANFEEVNQLADSR